MNLKHKTEQIKFDPLEIKACCEVRRGEKIGIKGREIEVVIFGLCSLDLSTPITFSKYPLS